MTLESTSVATINFTRGVPANESFPIDEVIDSALSALKVKGAAMLQYGPAQRAMAAGWQKVDVDASSPAAGSSDHQFLCMHALKPGDVVFTDRPHHITLLRRHGVVGTRRSGWLASRRQWALRAGAEVLLHHPD